MRVQAPDINVGPARIDSWMIPNDASEMLAEPGDDGLTSITDADLEIESRRVQNGCFGRAETDVSFAINDACRIGAFCRCRTERIGGFDASPRSIAEAVQFQDIIASIVMSPRSALAWECRDLRRQQTALPIVLDTTDRDIQQLGGFSARDPIGRDCWLSRRIDDIIGAHRAVLSLGDMLPDVCSIAGAFLTLRFDARARTSCVFSL